MPTEYPTRGPDNSAGLLVIVLALTFLIAGYLMSRPPVPHGGATASHSSRPHAGSSDAVAGWRGNPLTIMPRNWWAEWDDPVDFERGNR
jgi:hypothetical protein